MAQSPLYPNSTLPVAPYVVQLDATHVIEVRNKGQQLGIYTVTPSGKKRGVLLPIDTWYSLERNRNLVNVAIDLATGSVAPSTVLDTVFNHNYYQAQHQEQVKYIKSCYENKNNTTLQNASSKTHNQTPGCHRYQPYPITTQQQPPQKQHQHHQQQRQQQQHQQQQQQQQQQVPLNYQQPLQQLHPHQQQQQQQNLCETFAAMEYFGESGFPGILPEPSTETSAQHSTTSKDISTDNGDTFSPAYVC